MLLYQQIINISGVGHADYVAAVATHASLTGEYFNCEKCKLKFNEIGRAAKGCFGEARTAIILQSLLFKNCPGNMVDPTMAHVFDLWASYQFHGLLPYPGTMQEQPAHIMELFRLFSHLENERKEQETRTQARRKKTRGK